MNKKDIVQVIKKDAWMMDILETVESLNLPDWWIGAGFVRSKVWDFLHGYTKRTPVPDIDIIYFNQKAIPVEDEKKHWKFLKEKYPEIKWSVTNIANRHIKTKRKPYLNSTEALSEWVETATSVGIKLKNGMIIISAPWGIEDLVNLVLKPTPKYKKDLKTFYQRVEDKEWLRKWPKLKIVE